MATIGGVALSIAAAYLVTNFNNIMDALQLVFSIVNAPLFATFLLGMFWRRATGDGAFFGLIAGTLAAALHYELTVVAGGASLIGKLAALHTYPSDMAQNFWGAIWAWSTCLAITLGVSLLTRPRPAAELAGLVYSLTPRIADGQLAWYARPAAVGLAVLALTLVLNVVFW
jgi:SSS family solute:Na+ symporter